MVTAVVTATPDVFGGKMLRDWAGPRWSEPGTGAAGDQGLASPRGPASECQWSQPGARTPGVGRDQACARYEARARCHCLKTHLSCGQLPVSPSQERDTSCVTSHDIVTLITVIVLSLAAVSSVSLLLPGIPTNI